jgi:tRNA nucleotidyltransferase/poly(A) polymerase|tara:strand:+ start:1696 stop:5214 length:3519 start_codon:yes stop_codon:yes gene_type:complete
MKFEDLNEHGKIVKGVNTTADVGTNQTSIEAGKLGFKVNKDGYPPELHSKAKKNSKPNTLYNLGLAEQFIDDVLQVDKPEKKLYTLEEWACIQGGHEMSENISKTGSKLRRKEKKKDCYMGDPDWPDLIDELDEKETAPKWYDAERFQEPYTPKDLEYWVNKSKQMSGKARMRAFGNIWGPPTATGTGLKDGYENISHTGTATAKSAKKKGLKPGDAEWFEHWFDLPYFMKSKVKEEVEYLAEVNPWAIGALAWLAYKGYKVGKNAFNVIKNAPPGSINADNLIQLAVGGGAAAKLAYDKMTGKHNKKEPTTEETDDVIARAEQFAQQAHADHKRKYTGDPYYVHLDEVRNIVKSAGGNINMQAAALLHDTIEDTATTEQDIKDEFGPVIAKLVVELTDVSKPEDGNRATRKGIDRDKLATVSADAQTIKYADLISNGKDIAKNDPKFAKVYQKEKADLLRVMTKGNKRLYQQAYDLLPDELKEWVCGKCYSEPCKCKKLKEENMNVQNVLNKDLQELDGVFDKNGFELRIVGGAVRDIALGKTPKDVDLATDATPNEMERIFDRAGIKNKPTGIEYGTITAIMNGVPYEVTTLRADVETDGRRAEVKFVRSWEEDAKRRDLTYNAMSLDFDGNLYDYHGGMDDLQDKVSRFVGDPAERIQEDYLRILRYFRFQGKLDSPRWSKQTIGAIKDNVQGLSNVSVERVWQEMSKLLSGKNIAQILKFMDKADVSKQINLSTSNASKVVDNQDALVNLARLVDDSSIAKRWKMSNDEHDTLNFLVTHKNKNLDRAMVQELISDGVDKNMLTKLAMLQGKTDLDLLIKRFDPKFPVSGDDLIAKGMKPGPELGKTLADLRNKWKQSDFKATKKDLLGESIKSFTEPKFEVEWDEAKRYPEFVKIGKEAWIELAKKGKPIDVDDELANKIENTEAGEENRHEFDNLEEPKKERFRKAVKAGTVELPIIARYSDGYLELVAGNTRLTGMMREFGSGKAWIFDVPDEIAVLGEEGPFGVLARKAGHAVFKSQYKKAAEFLHKILTRKYKETGGHLRHTLGYYAMMIATQTGMKLNWRELQAEYLDMYGNEFFEDELTEDAVPYADIAAMATVAGVTWPIMKNMIKVAWKTGKGMYKITRIAQKAGVKLAKFSMGEENEKSKFVPNEQHSRRKSQAIHRYS